MDASVRRQCDEILLWRRSHGGQTPKRSRDVCEEDRLAKQQNRLKSRASKAVDAKPSGRQLNQDEVLDLIAYLLSRGNPSDLLFR